MGKYRYQKIKIIKATSIPPNKQFCFQVKIVWKDQLFFVVAYQNHNTLKGYGLDMALTKGVWSYRQ